MTAFFKDVPEGNGCTAVRDNGGYLGDLSSSFHVNTVATGRQTFYFRIDWLADFLTAVMKGSTQRGTGLV